MIILKLDFDFDSQAEISSEFGKKVGWILDEIRWKRF